MSIYSFKPKIYDSLEPPLGAGVFPRKGEKKRLEEKLALVAEKAKEKTHSISLKTYFGISPPLLRPVFSFVPIEAGLSSKFWKNDETIQQMRTQLFITVALSKSPIDFIQLLIQVCDQPTALFFDPKELVIKFSKKNPEWLSTNKCQISSNKEWIFSRISTCKTPSIIKAILCSEVVEEEPLLQEYTDEVLEKLIQANNLSCLIQLARENFFCSDCLAIALYFSVQYKKEKILIALLENKPLNHCRTILAELPLLYYENIHPRDLNLQHIRFRNVRFQSHLIKKSLSTALKNGFGLEHFIAKGRFPVEWQLFILESILNRYLDLPVGIQGDLFDFNPYRRHFEMFKHALAMNEITIEQRNALVRLALKECSPLKFIHEILATGPVNEELLQKIHQEKDQIILSHSLSKACDTIELFVYYALHFLLFSMVGLFIFTIFGMLIQ
jgi:hypothetical protein